MLGISFYIIKFLRYMSQLKKRGKLSLKTAYKKTFEKDPENFIRYGRAVSVTSALVSGNLLQASSNDIVKAMLERWKTSGLKKSPSDLINSVDEALFDAVDLGFLEKKNEKIYILTDTGGEIGRDWVKKMQFGFQAGIKIYNK